jgi:FkbM family methyltransferase
MKNSFERLARIAELGFKPTCIYDCGAFIGHWTNEVHSIFPESHFVLVEPNALLHEEIRNNTATFSDQTTLIPKAVSDSKGEITLNIWEDKRHNNPITAMAASSVCSHVQGAPAKQLTVDKTTVDDIATETGRTPDFLKLDLQGFEKFALQGAEKSLKHAEVVMIEFGCLDAYIDRTTPNDLMQCLYGYGFVLYDIVDLLYRPYDGALAGGDFIFVKGDSILKAHKDFF